VSTATAHTSRERDWLEVIATFLLAFAAVTTAWSGYQATRWNGEQARAASRTNALRVEAARSQSLAESATEVDVATFIEWVDATAKQDSQLADFYEARFRPEFQTSFDAWIALDPLGSPGAPRSPFAMEEYQEVMKAQTETIDAQADASAEIVNRNIQRASNYVLVVVLMSVSLFFAGISTKLRTPRLRTITLVIGSAVFICTLTWLATFPISLSV
jgi:hypothetical protein